MPILSWCVYVFNMSIIFELLYIVYPHPAMKRYIFFFTLYIIMLVQRVEHIIIFTMKDHHYMNLNMYKQNLIMWNFKSQFKARQKKSAKCAIKWSMNNYMLHVRIGVTWLKWRLFFSTFIVGMNEKQIKWWWSMDEMLHCVSGLKNVSQGEKFDAYCRI